MKRAASFLIAILLIACSAYTQGGLTFKMEYKPQKKYNQSMQQTIAVEVNYPGPKDSTDSLEQGIKNPMVTKVESSIESVLKTGKKNNAGEFPVSLEFVNVTGNNDKGKIAAGTIFYGHCGVHKSPVYDSIYSPDGKEEEARKIADVISKTLSQIQLPDKQMKPGDEYRQEYPISFPVEKAKFDMTVVTVYKLNSIKDNIGFFDFSVDYVATALYEGTSMPMKGKGKGKMELDAVNSFIRNYELNMDIEMNMNIQGTEMKMASHNFMMMHSTVESL